jgi:hypothetical protein
MNYSYYHLDDDTRVKSKHIDVAITIELTFTYVMLTSAGTR